MFREISVSIRKIYTRISPEYHYSLNQVGNKVVFYITDFLIYL